ncbi:MAG: tRNA (guanosine(46)-N7)-methyltransferase TrmB [Chitinophagales bacterium]
MAKKKLIRLSELETFANVYQLSMELKGKWKLLVFQNFAPITLELACGKGEYTVALARNFPARNFIGIDIKGARIWRGAKTALEEKISNAAFLRTYIDHITAYFEPGEVAEIWITFPDPYHENSKMNKRLTSSVFLRRYMQILQPGGIIHLKTDDQLLYEFSLDTIAKENCRLLFNTDNLYASDLPDEILSVRTFYEKQHLANGKTIKYIRFTFNAALHEE